MREGSWELMSSVREKKGHVVVLDRLPDRFGGYVGFENGFAIWIGGCYETLKIWKTIWKGFSLFGRHSDGVLVIDDFTDRL